MYKVVFASVFVLAGYQGSSQWTTSGNNIYNTNTGNVGIGTNTPAYALDVNGDLRVQSKVQVGTTLYMEQGSDGYSYLVTNRPALRVVSSGDIWLQPAGSNFTRAFGNLLVINSATSQQGLLLGSNKINTRDYYNYHEGLVIGAESNNALKIFGQTGNLVVQTNGTYSDAGYKMDIKGTLRATSSVFLATTDGNVGIGTSSPGPYKLAVEGWLGARKIKVTQATPWADYVFYEDYRLRTLEDVEQFIKEHRHLPEVPSATEVEKEGIDLGDNQALLLRKIEELTLYLLEQNKRTGLLIAEVESLKKEINELKNRDK